MLCTASCVQSVCVYVCANVWMNVYVRLWIKSKTLPIWSGRRQESAAKWKSKDVFLFPSPCRRCVLSDLMLFDVFESDPTVHTHPFFVFIKPFGNFLPVAYTVRCTHLFYAHQQRRNPKSSSLINWHKLTVGIHHQCRAFIHIAVWSMLLSVSSHWIYLFHSLLFACCQCQPPATSLLLLTRMLEMQGMDKITGTYTIT